MNAASAHSPRRAARARLLERQHLAGARRLARPGLHLSEPALEQRALQPQAVAALDLRDQPAVAVAGRLGRSQRGACPSSNVLSSARACSANGSAPVCRVVRRRHADAGKAHDAPVGQAEQVAGDHFGDRDRTPQWRSASAAPAPPPASSEREHARRRARVRTGSG